ncbi:MAG: 2Fe-2S iron-sulfur cluster binding domain-containing protein [Afipia sp.]|nr:2Fe-2S iron-sulfur cluster binding domain-containing protein [Afipia sp.]
MTFSISVTNKDIAFECGSDETVLDAAERAGYSIPYSCRKGVCSSCAGELFSGQVTVRGHGIFKGPASGVLFCQARPTSNLEISPTRIRKTDLIERKTFSVKVRKLERLSSVAIIQLRLPIGRRVTFRAGQYLRVLLSDGDTRNYSMANPPQKSDEIELHIRHVPGGKFSEGVLANLTKAGSLDIELPYGEFSLSDTDDQQAILIATGTGFAPFKSIIESNIRLGSSRPLHLYWGANVEGDLYMLNLVNAWAQQYEWFSFTPVVSTPTQWRGRTGFVHRAVQEDYPDMSRLKVYACGAPIMIESAQRDFAAQNRLPKDSFFSDAFVSSGDTAMPATLPE